MQGQHLFELPPRHAGEWPGAERKYKPLPGRLHLECMKIPQSSSGIILTDRGKQFCDVARVVASGVPELSEGQTVLLMAGVGAYLGREYTERMVGASPTAREDSEAGDDWWTVIPARLEGFHWVLSPGWFWAHPVGDGPILSVHRQNRYRVHCPEVLGYEGGYVDLTEQEMIARGWELFCITRPGGFKRHLVLT